MNSFSCKTLVEKCPFGVESGDTLKERDGGMSKSFTAAARMWSAQRVGS